MYNVIAKSLQYSFSFLLSNVFVVANKPNTKRNKTGFIFYSPDKKIKFCAQLAKPHPNCANLTLNFNDSSEL